MVRIPRQLPRALRQLLRAWPPILVFCVVAAAAGGSALYVRQVTQADAQRVLHARANEFSSLVAADARLVQAAVTIAGAERPGEERVAIARDIAPLLDGTLGIGVWIAVPAGAAGHVIAEAGAPSALRRTLSASDWRAVFAVRGVTQRPTIVRRRPDGSLLLGVVSGVSGGRAVVVEIDVRQMIAGTIGRTTGIEAALYAGTQPTRALQIAATTPDGRVAGPRVARQLSIGDLPCVLLVGDPTAVGPAWLPRAIFLGGLVVALVAGALVEALRRRRDAALATVDLLEDRNRELDDLGIQLRSAAAELAHRADHDELTGLANRAVLHRRVHEAAAGGAAGVLLFDLDDFKTINDTLGHEAGDAALRVAAERLAAATPREALAVRLGGDEFAICAPTADAAALRALSERVLAQVSGPARLAGRPVHLRLSIGTAAWPGTSDDPGDLLRDADLAMYAAKRARRAGDAVPIAHYEAGLRVAVEARSASLAELRTALAGDQLVVHYQPLVDLRSGEPVALEALVRWQHPARGLLAPPAFVPVAEEGGLIGPIGRLVVETACRDLATLRRHHPALTMSVNVSALELAEAGFAERILGAVEAHGLEPSAIELEITERVLVDVRAALPTLERLRRSGVRVAIDDFGTGYSSLLYLRRLPMTGLKIDRAFVADSDAAAGRGILAALLDLARHASLEAVAEGVETPEQLTLLRELGCTRAQGYLFSRPLPLGDLRGWLGKALAA